MGWPTSEYRYVSTVLKSRFSLWLGLSRFAPYGAQSMALAAG
jgi:hypothetical protein